MRCSQSVASHPSIYRNAVISVPESSTEGTKLGFSRAYSISLSPKLIYTRSNLLPALVSSKVYRQLEFLAIGSWWLYNDDDAKTNRSKDPILNHASFTDHFLKIPGGREDVFGDPSIDLRSTRLLVKFLKLAADSEAHGPFLETWGSSPFPQVLASEFKIPPELQSPIVALTLSPNTPSQTTTSYAISRIHRHLTSIGLFGPGFGSVIPKWGGPAEICQVACRAGAVGGGVYVLKNGIKNISIQENQPEAEDQWLKVLLQNSEEVKARWVAGTKHDLPNQFGKSSSVQVEEISRSITIISSRLHSLFPLTSEGAPTPAGAVIVFPTGSNNTVSNNPIDNPPVYFMVHSADTGECPNGQSKSNSILQQLISFLHRR